MKFIIISILVLISFISGYAQYDYKRDSFDLKANSIDYRYFKSVCLNDKSVRYFVENLNNKYEDSGIWTEVFPMPKLATDSNVFYQTFLEVFGGVQKMSTMGEYFTVYMAVDLNGNVLQINTAMDSASLISQFQAEDLETKIKARFTYTCKKDFVGFNKAKFIVFDWTIEPQKLAAILSAKMAICDPASSSFNPIDCAKSRCDPKSLNYDTTKCSKP